MCNGSMQLDYYFNSHPKMNAMEIEFPNSQLYSLKIKELIALPMQMFEFIV